MSGEKKTAQAEDTTVEGGSDENTAAAPGIFENAAAEMNDKAAASDEFDPFETPMGDFKGNGGEGYKPHPGPHMATCVAVVYNGEIKSEKFNKVQKKVQFVWAFADQNVTFKKEGSDEQEDSGEPVCITSPMITLSSGEKATLSKLFKNVGIKETDKTMVTEMLGIQAMIFTDFDEEGKYPIIELVKPAVKGQKHPAKPIYLPKFLLSDSNGKPTGFKIKAHATLVIPGERPKHEKA
jgi:hypothetical protein